MPTFPSLPVPARWPDPSEELASLREFRADYDRLMSTEGQSHGEAIAVLSGLVASARQRPDPDEVDRRCAELRAALTPTDDDGPLAREHIADMIELVDMIEMLNAENRVLADRCNALADRVTAAEGWLDLARTTPGPHIPPALLRRVEALGFVPGSGEPVGWLVAEMERMKADHTALLLGVGRPMWLPSVADAVDHPDQFNATPDEVLDRVRAVVAERDELAAALANERGEGEPPCEGWRYVASSSTWRRTMPPGGYAADVLRADWTRYGNGRECASWTWWRTDGTEGRCDTARAAMIAADAATKRPA